MGKTFGGEARVRSLEVLRSTTGIHERDLSEEVMGWQHEGRTDQGRWALTGRTLGKWWKWNRSCLQTGQGWVRGSRMLRSSR